MEILKYLDVMIGLAVVMVLLSPLVSAITQVFVWLGNMRSGRLQVGLENLLLQLNGSPYERFDAAEVSGLPPNSKLLFDEGSKDVDASRSVTLTESVPAMLRANHGKLRDALKLKVGDGAPEPLPLQCPVRLRPRGTVETWTVTSSGTDATGTATAAYNFLGPNVYASREATVSPGITGNPSITISISSGAYKGQPLTQRDGVWSYPNEVKPVPAVHDLFLKVVPAPAVGTQLTLTFKRLLVEDGVLQESVSLEGEDARQIADAVLLHPMIAQPTFLRYFRARKGEVVEREEFIRILLEFAANPTRPVNIVEKAIMRWLKPAQSEWPSAAMQKLQLVLRNNDLPDPGRALSDIRDAAQTLELTEPAKSANERLTRAILMCAQSSFVGRINNWFDQAMDRTTAEYKFRAQLITVGAALVVATVVQLDSIDLLQRLSTDSKLRESLVQQAGTLQKRVEDQQKRVDEPPKGASTTGSKDELQNAKAQRDEIEGNLAKMRDPQLAILPDHFLWQRLPQGRLMNNPKLPSSPRLELVAGGRLYPLAPRWTSDPLTDVEAVIRNSGAPVKTSRDHGRKQFTVTGPNAGKVHVNVHGTDLLTHTGASASFDDRRFPADGPIYHTDWFSRGPRSVWHWLQGGQKCTATIEGQNNAVKELDPCTAAGVKDALQAFSKESGITVAEISTDHLVLAASRLGAVQLRSNPGSPESNILNAAEEWSCNCLICFDSDLFWSSWRGVLLSWILLSLGAPFWYDALKDLLKLRSSLAKKEEDARVGRQTAAPTV